MLPNDASLFVILLPLQQVGPVHEFAQVDLPAQLTLHELQALRQLTHLGLEDFHSRLQVVARLGARHFGVVELALQGGEEIERIPATVGPRDLTFLFTEERYDGRIVTRLATSLIADV